MILIISERNEDCIRFRRKLSLHYKTNCFCNEYFSSELIENYSPDVIIIYLEKMGSKIEKINTIIETISGKIPLLILCDETIDPPDNLNNVELIPVNDFSKLINVLGTYKLQGISSEEVVNGLQVYIRQEIRLITSLNDVFDGLELNKRKAGDEFKYRTGKTIQEFMGDARLEAVTNELKQKLELGGYYAAAVETGFHSEAALANFILKRTGKTVREYHSEILKNLK